MSNDIVTSIPNSISPYLNEIAERLWSGHAAIMIGAGFSKNATPNGTSSRRFPDWYQLGDLFYEKTNGVKPNSKSRYLNVLKLADEIQAALGRPVLDQILRDAIPDYEYEPSPLHVKLLDLPWTDVFTTNYDTLLERACISVSSQKYDVVINKEDLVYSEKPRIIKLHGSFPSERPFVITEEDYRRYPKDFAPFVNTVQQALLENTLCLIGFSGDDPNFLHWIGWIRDNLGSENSPKIYLVGILNLSSAQKKLLEQRNIVLIDMSVCTDTDGNHYKGLEQFLNYLISRKAEDNRLGWPVIQKHQHRDPNKDKASQIIELIAEWKNQRLAYPGWVIVPEDRRNILWTDTQPWIDFISSKDQLPGYLDLEFAFELSWRMEKSLCPIMNHQINFFEAVLNKYLILDDVPDSSELPSLNLKAIAFYVLEIDEHVIKTMCIYLVFSMLRFYREEGLLDKWGDINSKIERSNLYKHISPEQMASLSHERALYELFGLDIQELKNKLEKWPINESLPFFEAKRAMLLAEIGEVSKAEQILEKSLKKVRSMLNLKPITTDYSLVSQEAIIMLLLRYVQAPISIEKTIQNEFSERWNFLKRYKCDPWNELKLLESSLERPPLIKSDVTIKQEFDIGRTTSVNHLVNEDTEALIAYRFLRFCEDAGIPFRIPGCTFSKKSAEGTLPRISQYSPYWAMVTMVRIGDSITVDYIFNRKSLAKIDVTTIDSLISVHLEVLDKSQEGIQTENPNKSDNFSAVLTKVVPEILSRLCCKCSTESKTKLINFLLKIYKSDQKSNYGGIQNLTKRLISSFTVQQKVDLIPLLLDFPILFNLSPKVELEFTNPFQFLDLNKELVEARSKPSTSDEKINTFIENGLSDNINERNWAIFTLSQLHELGFLGLELSNKFAETLWYKRDDYGLPDQTNFYKFAFLSLPHPADVNPIILFKNYVQSTPFPIQRNSSDQGIAFIGSDIPICHEIVGACKYLNWSKEEINSIFSRLVEWWDSDKDYLKKEDSLSPFRSIANEFRGRFARLVNILVAVITENFDPNTEMVIKKDGLLRLIKELQDYGIPILRLESACLHIYPEFQNHIFDKIENSLASNIHDTVNDGLNAILTIAKNSKSHKEFHDLLPHLLMLLSQIILWRKRTGLLGALKVLKILIDEHISQFNDDLEKTVLIGLQNIAKDTNIDADNLDISEKLAIRQEAAGLAYKLFVLYTKQGKQVPDSILEWRNICQSALEFSETQNQWLFES